MNKIHNNHPTRNKYETTLSSKKKVRKDFNMDNPVQARYERSSLARGYSCFTPAAYF